MLAFEVQDLYGSRVLTAIEMRVISLVAEGKKNDEVASAIGMRVHIVKKMMQTIFDKVGVWNRTELALWHVSRVG